MVGTATDASGDTTGLAAGGACTEHGERTLGRGRRGRRQCGRRRRRRSRRAGGWVGRRTWRRGRRRRQRWGGWRWRRETERSFDPLAVVRDPGVHSRCVSHRTARGGTPADDTHQYGRLRWSGAGEERPTAVALAGILGPTRQVAGAEHARRDPVAERAERGIALLSGEQRQGDMTQLGR